MNSLPYPWAWRELWSERPSLGWLLARYEDNYRVLMRLFPALQLARGAYQAASPQGPDLHLEVLEQTPYTSLVRLTYVFAEDDGAVPDPDATLRVYHDAAQVEVLALRQTALPLSRGNQIPTLEQKWRINTFLYKWLTYCQRQGYGFAPAARPAARRGWVAQPAPLA